jgi:hypothetical protein
MIIPYQPAMYKEIASRKQMLSEEIKGLAIDGLLPKSKQQGM